MITEYQFVEGPATTEKLLLLRCQGPTDSDTARRSCWVPSGRAMDVMMLLLLRWSVNLDTGASLLRTRSSGPSVFSTGTCNVPPSVFTTGTCTVPPSVFSTGTCTVPPCVFTTGTCTVPPNDHATTANPRRLQQGCPHLLAPKFSKTSTLRSWMMSSLAPPLSTGVEPAERFYQHRTLRVDRRATVKDKGLPESSHRTTDARRYWVSANVAKTATGIRWMQSASPAASNLPAAVGSQDQPPQDEARCPGPLGSPANRTTNPTDA